MFKIIKTLLSEMLHCSVMRFSLPISSHGFGLRIDEHRCLLHGQLLITGGGFLERRVVVAACDRAWSGEAL
jgi:hypothetical protein